MHVLKLISYFVFALAAFGSANVAFACAICAPSADQNSLVYRLSSSDVAVLAKTNDMGKTGIPLKLIKGEMPKMASITIADKLPTAAGFESAESILLLFNPFQGGWINAGAMPLERAPWLVSLVGLRPGNAMQPTDTGWPERIRLFVKDLEHPLPLLSQTAYDEIAIAPYTVMRTLRPFLNENKLRQWVKSDALIQRRSLYFLLLGFAGDIKIAPDLEHEMKSRGASMDKGELSSMMAALVELRGDAGVEWIDTNYFKTKERSDKEVQAAVLALTVHGNDGVKINRDRVVKSYADYIKANPERAGFVASDLGNWGRWEFVNDYMALLRSGAQQAFASRYSIVLYLMRSPSQEARNALEQLRAEGIL